jgi:predicted kinase
MNQVIVLRGLPGSGKSTLIEREFPKAVVVSADHFFINLAGKYCFDPSKIGEAHAACFRRYILLLQTIKPELVIVDNTNTSEVEIAPYMLGAAAFEYEAKVVTVSCDPKVAAARNTHGVPEEVVLKMNVSLQKPLPPWWVQESR